MNISILYRRCRQVIDEMLKEGYGAVDRIRWNDIEPYVALRCGADPRTLEKYRKYFVYFGFFKETRATIFEWCDRDKFNNPVKTVQTDMSLLRVLSNKRIPKRNY